MSYDPALKEAYERHDRLMRIVRGVGSELASTLLDDSADASSEMLGDVVWSSEGVRFSIQRWDWKGNKWAHHHESSVQLTPTQVEEILKDDALRNLADLKAQVKQSELLKEIARFEIVFNGFDDAMKEALFGYLTNAPDGISWALAMEYVVSGWYESGGSNATD